MLDPKTVQLQCEYIEVGEFLGKSTSQLVNFYWEELF